MATEIKIEIIKCEAVKPSTPTPDNRRTYELSLIDQFAPTQMIAVLLFYPASTLLSSVSETSKILTNSLSQTLTRFPQFAGRLQDNTAIECNDAGAEFLGVKINCPLSAILTNPDNSTLLEFVPIRTYPKEALCKSPLLLVRVNFFDCGGLAIGVCLSHKVADAATLSMFLSFWATAASPLELEPALTPPELVSSASIFIPLKSFVSFPDPYSLYAHDADEKIVLKRMVFHRQGIEALRRKAADNYSGVANPTRVEAVSALIWKCMIETIPGVSGSCFKQAVNLRKRMTHCLTESSVGNLVWVSQAKIGEADKTELKDLVVVLRNGMDELKAMNNVVIRPEMLAGLVESMSRQDDDNSGSLEILASSWCRFSFYRTDFGWGKPLWICTPLDTMTAKNLCVMMDTRDGEGIEATLLFGEEEMKRFETNQELLPFASLDPAVIV